MIALRSRTIKQILILYQCAHSYIGRDRFSPTWSSKLRIHERTTGYRNKTSIYRRCIANISDHILYIDFLVEKNVELMKIKSYYNGYLSRRKWT